MGHPGRAALLGEQPRPGTCKLLALVALTGHSTEKARVSSQWEPWSVRLASLTQQLTVTVSTGTFCPLSVDATGPQVRPGERASWWE